MLICNNGSLGAKRNHKSFRTAKFIENAKKRRRR